MCRPKSKKEKSTACSKVVAVIPEAIAATSVVATEIVTITTSIDYPTMVTQKKK